MFRLRAALLGCALTLAAWMPAAKADIIGFNGPWDPTNPANGFSLTSFFPWGCQLSNPGNPCGVNMNYTAGSMSLSIDHSTLTITLVNDPTGIGLDQTYSNSPAVSTWASWAFIPGAGLPTGPLSFDFDVTFSGTVTQASVVFYPYGSDFGNGRVATFTSASHLTGTVNAPNASLMYFDGGFDSSGEAPVTVTIVLSNFVGAGDLPVPAPASLALLGTGLVAAGALRRRRAA